LLAAYLHLTFSGDLVYRGLVPRSLQTESLGDKIGELEEISLPNGPLVGTIFTFVTLFLLLVVIPCILIWIMVQNEEQLHFNSHGVYCGLHEGVKTDNFNTKSMNLIFILRRVLFMCIVIYQPDKFQLMSV